MISTNRLTVNPIGFGRMFRSMRGEMSVCDLAKKAEVEPIQIEQLERGEILEPPFELVARISVALGYSLDMVAAAVEIGEVNDDQTNTTTRT